MTDISQKTPFVGLRAFDKTDHRWFRGRSKEIETLLRKVRSNPFTAVVGASGSGKSSLVRAGVLVPLEQEDWQCIIVKPGAMPISHLASAFSEAMHGGIRDSLTDARTYRYDAELRQSAFGLVEIARRLVPDGQQLLLVVDQFEELFRYGEEKQGIEKAALQEEGRAFVELLLTAVLQSAVRLHVIITMRSDFFGNCANYTGLAEAVSASQYLVPLPNREQLIKIISKPIADAGGEMDGMLVQRMLLDVAEQVDLLPTLQHTLRRLWEVAQGEPRRLSEEDYKTIGGMTGSIDTKAEQIATELKKAHKEDFITLERMMKAITALDDQGRATRHPQKRSALLGLITEVLGDHEAAKASLDRVLKALTNEEISFIQLSGGDDPEVDIGHEALIRSWRRLCGEGRDFKTGWLIDERDDGRQWWDLVWRAKNKQFSSPITAWQTRNWIKKKKIGPLWCERYGGAWEAIKAFYSKSFFMSGSLYLITIILVIALVGWLAVGAWKQINAPAARTSALAAAGYARSLTENGNARVGALVAFSVTPEDRDIEDSHYVDEIRTSLANALLTRPIEIMRLDHVKPVRSVAFSPNDNRIFSISGDKTLRLWNVNNAKTGEDIDIKEQVLDGYDESVFQVLIFSPDGKTIVSYSAEGNTLYLRHAETGKRFGKRLRGYSKAFSSIVFSPDGKQIATGSVDNTLRLWDASTGKAIGEPLRGRGDKIVSIVFSPDGKRIVSGSLDDTLRLWDIETGNVLWKKVMDEKRIDDYYLERWSFAVAFSPDGKRIVSASSDNTLRLWKAKTGKAIRRMEGHEALVLSVAFSPDGEHIVSGSLDNTLRLWDGETGNAIGKRLSGHTDGVNSVAFSSDGKRIVSGSFDKTLRLWDVRTASREAIGKPWRYHNDNIQSIAFSPDGKRIVSASSDNTLRLWKAKTGKAIRRMEGHKALVVSVAFSPDGKRIISGSFDKTLRLWNSETGEAIGKPLEGHTGKVTSVAFSPKNDDKRIVSGSFDKTLRLWNAETGKAIGKPLEGHEALVLSVAFSPDGKRIVSGSSDKTLRLWNAETMEAIGNPLSGHDAAVRSVAFSPDGKRIVSGSFDKTLRLWDVETGEAIGKPLEGHTGKVASVAFSPKNDDKRIVSGSFDKTLRLWNPYITPATLEELASKAEKLCPLNLDERKQLGLIDPKADKTKEKDLTDDQRRACGK